MSLYVCLLLLLEHSEVPTDPPLLSPAASVFFLGGGGGGEKEVRASACSLRLHFVPRMDGEIGRRRRKKKRRRRYGGTVHKKENYIHTYISTLRTELQEGREGKGDQQRMQDERGAEKEIEEEGMKRVQEISRFMYCIVVGR